MRYVLGLILACISVLGYIALLLALFVQTTSNIPAIEPSPYLLAPGNRTHCNSGAWIATQADSSRAPWRVRCTEEKS